MAGKRELEAVIRLSGITDPSLQKALRQAQKELQSLGNSGTQAVGKQLESAGKSIGKIGKAWSKYVTAPIVAGGTLALKAAIDYESAFAGVRKTVNATEEEYAALSHGIRSMSEELPASAEAIAGVMEMAGQLGIEKKNLQDFTRVMIDLGESTNLSATEGAEELAKFANITRMSQKDFDRLGSVIVSLGNQTATTEADIAHMAMRLAGAGSQIGLSEAEIMAFSAALSSVGIEAEAGGSAFSKVMVGMQLAVETGKDGLEDFARVSGMSAKEFQVAFKRDAAGALQAFVVGLSKMDEQGISAIKTLDDMGITEVRLRDTLLRATNANELFAKTQEIAGSAWRDNTALAAEAGERYKTTASQLGMLKNAGAEVLRQLGEMLLPYLKTAMNSLKGVSQWIKKLSPQQKDMAVKLAGIAAAAGPVLTVFGKFIAGSGKLMQSGSGLLGLLGKVGGALGVAGLAGTALWGIYSALKAIDDAATSERLAARFGSEKIRAEELEAALAALNTPMKEKVDAFLAQSEALNEAWNNVQATQEEIRGLNYRIDAANVNVDMSEEERQALSDALAAKLHTLSGQVVDLIHDKWYKVKLAFDISGPEFQQSGIEQIQNDLQAFYHQAQQEAISIQQDLYETVNSETFKAMTPQEQDAIVNAKIAEYNSIMSRIALGVAEQHQNVLDAMMWKAANGMYSREEGAHLQQLMVDENAGVIAGLYEAQATALAEIVNLSKNNAVARDETGRIIGNYGDEAFTNAAMKKVSDYYDNLIAVARADETAIPALIAANQARAAFDDELGAFLSGENWGMGEAWTKAVDTMKPVLTNQDDVSSTLNSALDHMTGAQKEARMLLDENKGIITTLDELLAANENAGGNLFDAEKLKSLQDARKVFSDLEAYRDFDPTLNVPIHEIINQAYEAGASVPEGMGNGITENEANAVDAAANMAASTITAMNTGLGYASPSSYGIAAGQSVPQGVAIGIQGLLWQVQAAMQAMIQVVRDGLAQIAGMSVTLPSVSGGGTQRSSGSKSKTGVTGFNSIKKYALGGTVYGPTSALLGEAGYPETVVPHTNSARSRALALEALRGTGVQFSGGGAPVFAPNITVTVQGNGDPNAIGDAVRGATDELHALFDRWLEDYKRTNARESFALQIP